MKRSRLVLPPKEYMALCKKTHQRDKHRCRCCGKMKPLSFHHIKFRSNGGWDSLENGCSLCVECHDCVHGKNPTHFIEILHGSGDPDIIPDANDGLKFMHYPKIQKRRASWNK